MEPFVIDPRHGRRHGTATAAALATLTAFNRVNALACIRSAGRGWLGATFSCAEILTVLHQHVPDCAVVLSKGHAAPMQYACLFALDRIDQATLLSYKDGPEGLQAHCDRSTPGILMNSGSLGQCLSKTAGLAWARPERRHAVILGDGELQEGQNFEAFQTIVHRRMANVTPIIDANGFQSELPVDRIKRIDDLPTVLRGFGFRVLEIDGHDAEAVAQAWADAADLPTAIIAHTVKAGGTTLLAPEDGRQPWHGRVPDDAVYQALVTELVEQSQDALVSEEWSAWCEATQAAAPAASSSLSSSSSSSSPSPALSTREAFGRELGRLLDEDDRVVVLDADLAKSCGIAALEGHPRFLEMGIAEQDEVSFAAGLSLAGQIPVVCTYAAFMRRAFEQIHANAHEGSRVVYAGGYGGLCYHTDGKTHQCLDDLAALALVPGMAVADPPTPELARLMLRWACLEAAGPVYLRLRRSAGPVPVPSEDFAPGRGIIVAPGYTDWVVATGTVALTLADELRAGPCSGFGLLTPMLLSGPVDQQWYLEALEHAHRVVVLGEDCGLTASLIRRVVLDLPVPPAVIAVDPGHGAGSFRTLAACREHLGFTPEAVVARMREAGW